MPGTWVMVIPSHGVTTTSCTTTTTTNHNVSPDFINHCSTDFKLDVDSPFPIPSREELMERPEPLNYPQNHPKYRFYGNNIKRMIDVANSWEEGDKKEGLILTIANHMKKCFLNWNKDTVEDEVIFEHLFELSGGKINLKNSDEDLSNASDLMKNKKRFNTNSSNKKNYKSNNRNRKRY